MPPFNGRTDQDIQKSILRGVYTMEGDIWDLVTDSAKDLIRNML